MSGYDKIANAVEKWCEKTGWYTTFLVTIAYKYDFEKEYTEETEILWWEDHGFVWDNDWWEGQQDVKLCGFMPIDSIRFHNAHYMLDELKFE